MVVVIGLVFATRKAIDQWNGQRAIAVERVHEIDRKMANATGELRSALAGERREAVDAIPSLTNLDWGRISLAGLLYAIGLIPGGIVLFEATEATGHRVSRRDALAAQLVGHLGKYVPGKAMVVVMRAARLSRHGVPPLAGSIAVVMETLSMMAVGAAFAGVLVCFLPVPRWIAVVAILGGVVSSLPTIPTIFRMVLRRIRPAVIGEELDSSWRFFIRSWLWHLMGWTFIGSSFALLVTSFPGAGTEHTASTMWVASVAATCLAMVVGFASLLPGGAGVRELTLALILSPVVGESHALLGAIAARLMFIAVELIAAGCVAGRGATGA